jgi:hypothetical protein
MEIRNIIGFKLENPGIEFPNFRSLKDDETQEVRRRLKQKVMLSKDADDLTLSKQIAVLSVVCNGDNANDDKFNLLEVLRRLEIIPSGLVYLNFYRFDEIDEMSVGDVSRHFKYIWYPHSDDIDIFDSTFKWILSVSHDGIVSLLAITH